MHILVGILFAWVIWKLLKLTFKAVLWILAIGLVVAIFSPGHLFLVGGVGLLILSVLGGLLIFSIAGFLFFEND
jgi:hypothetical protein